MFVWRVISKHLIIKLNLLIVVVLITYLLSMEGSVCVTNQSASSSFVGLVLSSIERNEGDNISSADGALVLLGLQLVAAVVTHTQMTTGHDDRVLFFAETD